MISNFWFRIVVILRLLGYISQFVSGLYLAGFITSLCAIPLIIWPSSVRNNGATAKSIYGYLKTNALAIHSYAGMISTLPIISYGVINYLETEKYGYIEIILLGILLLISFLLFNMSPPKKESSWNVSLFRNKHRVASLILLLANIFQYSAGVNLQIETLSLASIFFLTSLVILFFVKPVKPSSVT